MELLSTRRFLPLFITQFLGAFNDNLFKNALVILVIFRIGAESRIPVAQLATIAGALFILPYFLFSATAGQIADKFDRARIARITKVWEIGIVAIGAIGFLGHHESFLLLVLFCLGTQSAFFGPVKYALLPQHLRDDELVAGNALIEAGTFLSILLGTICGGLLVTQENGEILIVATTLCVALAGYAASRFIPTAPAPVPELKPSFNIIKITSEMVSRDRANQRVFRSILGISWFWLVGAVFLSQFPVLVKDVVGGNEAIVTLFLAMFSLGVGAGSYLSNILVRGAIDSKYVPYAAFGMSAFMFDLMMVASGHHYRFGDSPVGVYEFIGYGVNLRILFDLFMIALCAGIFVVPLYAIMQHDSDVDFRARTIASNNVMNALFMVVSAGVCAGILAAGYGVLHIFALTASLNLLAGLYVRRIKREN
jgi:acyl-[acyl-carrier-protein]-phospholipid O-acyltransferase/long-chain-fatty-acid--[acyl-carrier-protein] ligase